MWKKTIFRNSSSCSCENGKYLASIMDDSVFMYDQFIKEERKTAEKNFNEKNAMCEEKVLYFICLFIEYNLILNSC